MNDRFAQLIKEKGIKKGKKEKMSSIAHYLKENPSRLIVWDRKTWMVTISSAIVHKDKTITFKFYSGQEVRV